METKLDVLSDKLAGGQTGEQRSGQPGKQPGDGQPGAARRRGVLLVNLGSPQRARAREVRRFLNEFLADPRVVDVPALIWKPLLKLVISPLRAPASAKKYRTVWTQEGSPLIIHSERLQEAVAAQLPDVHVGLAMRYGQPSIASQVTKMVAAGVQDLTVLPLFPQYSSTTTAPIMDAVADALRAHRGAPAVRFIRDFADHELYLDALAASVRKSFQADAVPDVLVLSYHGIPSHYATAGDDYPARCQATTDGLVRRLGLDPKQVMHTYQSKFGPREWLGPATITTVEELAKQGVKHISVVAPAFVADCLETLEELDQLNRETFIDAGGETFRYIPALNSDPALVSALVQIFHDSQPATHPVAIPQGG